MDRVLGSVQREVRWNRRHVPRPPHVAPGFLTAVDRLMRSSAVRAREAGSVPLGQRFPYVYKDATYDLVPRRFERIAELRTRSGVYRNLVRSDIALVNRASGWTTSFSVTYGTSGALAGVPVAARYQPNWWFRVELELDGQVDVPQDPAGDPSIRERMASLCLPPEARLATAAR
jgi:hypothetical protein